jgi:hypothetical protein
MFPQFDPSKMDPQIMMQLSQLIQQLPPEKLNQMQSLMHNAMAGYDVKAQMEEFERSLPAGFREKLMSLIASNPSAFMPGAGEPSQGMAPQGVSEPSSSGAMDVREARLTVLRGVASGKVSPEEAEQLLFNA